MKMLHTHRIRPVQVWGILVVLFVFTPIVANGEEDEGTEIVQATCPVMEGNPINPELFTVYKGKKVYFCCPPCKAAFEKDPEKYLPLLPQFAGMLMGEQEEGGHEHGEESHKGGGIGKLIGPLGISTLSLVGLTVVLGVFRKKWKPRVMMKVHKTCGVLALISGAAHAAIVMFH